MRVKRVLQGIFWVLVYIVITAAPLVVLMIGPTQEGREFWRVFSVGLGFAGLAMMALQFVLTARFKVIKSPYGADIVYHFHRQISLVAFVMIIAHPLILFLRSPALISLLNVFSAPNRARAGVTSIVALILLIGTSVYRKQLKLEYTRWRILHGILSAAAVILAMLHVLLVGNYINTPVKQVLWIGYGAFWVGLLVWIRILKPITMLRHPYEVVEVREERGSSWTLVLKPVNHKGMRFIPGQFAWMHVWKSVFGESEHPFSFSSSAEEEDILAFTIKELGDFTATVKDIKPGQKVYLDGPFGSFSIDRHPDSKGFVFIAGGVGITPMMSMLRTMRDRNDQRPVTLLYANNEWETVTFREEIAELEKQLNLKVVYVMLDPPEGWEGETGFVTREILDRYLPEDRSKGLQPIFICGPGPMMDAVERVMPDLGVHMGDFHAERFELV